MSTRFAIAHIRHQGQNIIIIPLGWQSIQTLGADEQEGMRLALEECAHAAGLAGTACIVWQLGRTFQFIAPIQWHPFFRGLNMALVGAMLNKTLICGASDEVDEVERERVRFARFDEEPIGAEDAKAGDEEAGREP